MESKFTMAGCTLRPDNTPSFPMGWLILSIVLIIIIVVILYFFYRQRVQLVEPNRVPTIRSRYAVVPGIDKEALNTCGTNQDPCIANATTLGKAIEYCNLNYTVCSEFVYDPISQMVKITDPSGARSSSQQGNLYLQQVGAVNVN
jgi:hypothetical protein